MSETIPAKTPRDSIITLTLLMGPTDANNHGNVHGGVLMKICDEAGAMAAVKHCRKSVVTVAVDRMTFDAPVHIGDLVTFTATVTYVGRTSIETQVVVKREKVVTGETAITNTAYFLYVALDENRKPSSVPPLKVETPQEISRHEAAAERQAIRLMMREQERRLKDAQTP